MGSARATTSTRRARARSSRKADVVDRANIGYVVIDSARTPWALREFSIRAYRLRLVEVDGAFELYRPAAR